MSRFFATGSDSESESSSEEEQVVRQPTNTFTFSDEEEDTKRVVRSAKEKRYEDLKNTIKQLRNFKKIKDMSSMLSSESITFDPPNLKTVLFKESYLLGRCWSNHEVNLLLNRRIMQDLVPRKVPRDLPLLLKYLKGIEGRVLRMPPSVNQTLIMMAVGDVIGSYLQSIVIPIANEAYYAGNADYSTVEKLHEMLDKWKWFLSTDGGSWSKECDMRKVSTKVAVLDIDPKDGENACQELYVSNDKDSGTAIPESLRIPTPYFDNNEVPNAIALPFKKRNLVSLFDPKSAYILVKYYTLSMRCLSEDSNSVLAFNNNFHVWIISNVVPHLHDQNRWYPAFGAVMRVVETIKQKSLSSDKPLDFQPVQIERKSVEDEHQDLDFNDNINFVGSSVKGSENIVSYFHIANNPYGIFILVALILVLLIMLLCMCCYLLFLRKKKKRFLFFGESEDIILKNALLSLFCSLKPSMKKSSESLEEFSIARRESEETTPVTKLLPYSTSPSYPNPSPVDSSDVSYSERSNSEEEFSGQYQDDA